MGNKHAISQTQIYGRLRKRQGRRHAYRFTYSLLPFAHILMTHLEMQAHLQVTVLCKTTKP